MGNELTEVEFAGHKVMVPKGGYYDRFRSNPDLDEVAKDPAAGNIDFFRRIPKVMVPSRNGPTWAPNFYYRTSNVQALMLAPLRKLRSMLPLPLEPLRALPGVVAEAGDMTVMMDSGVRRGTDVLKALALGAKFVFIGRPFLYAAAIAGAAGVHVVWQQLGAAGGRRVVGGDVHPGCANQLPLLHL